MPSAKEEVSASVFRRIPAFIIDLLVVNFLVFFPFYKIIISKLPLDGVDTFVAFETNAQVSTTFTVVAFLVGVLTLCYFSIFQYILQQTPGMIFLNLKVKSVNNELTLWRSFVRNLMFLPVTPFSLLFIVDAIFWVFNKKGQRFTEWLGHSMVVLNKGL